MTRVRKRRTAEIIRFDDYSPTTRYQFGVEYTQEAREETSLWMTENDKIMASEKWYRLMDGRVFG